MIEDVKLSTHKISTFYVCHQSINVGVERGVATRRAQMV